jgi:tetratricopeptide (TPR) repeat protein
MNPEFSFTANSLLVKFRGAGRTLVNAYKSAVSLNPRQASEVYKNLGASYYRKGDATHAIAILKKAMELNPDDAQIAGKLGRAYFNHSKMEEALAVLEKAVKLSPNIKDFICIGQIYNEKGDHGKAIKAFKKAVELKPDEAKIHYQLGITYDKQNKYDKSIECFKKAIELNPYVPKYHFSLGFTYDTKGDHKEAIKAFKKAIALERE